MFLLGVLALSVASSLAEYLNPPNDDKLLLRLSEGLTFIKNEPLDARAILKEYDFIVVGAGSAGSAVASRLSEIPEWKILLIEAGREENSWLDVPSAASAIQSSEYNWGYKTVPSDKYCLGMTNKSCNFPRGKVMGGSSSINYMIYTRGNPKDFDYWEAQGNPGWGWRDVLPYFKKMEDMTIDELKDDKKLHSRGGAITVSEAPYHTGSAQAFVTGGLELGYSKVDVNSENQTGFSFLPLSQRNGTRCSASRGYLHPARNRRNLHVRKFSLVTRVIIDPETKIATGVEFERGNKRHIVRARKEVILSAGSIGSSQILMLSGIGPKKHLESKGIKVIKSLAVGYNLQDHVALGGLHVLVDAPITFKMHRLQNDPTAVEDFLTEHRGPYSVPSGCEAIAYFDTKNDNPSKTDGWTDLELLMVGGTVTSDPNLKINFNINDDIFNALYNASEYTDGFTVVPMIMRPKSSGYILLKDKDPHTKPLIIPNWFDEEEDLDIAVKGVRKTQELLATPSWRKLNARLLDIPIPGCTSMPFDSDDYWKCHVRHLSITIYHLSGVCKMGPSTDRTAVVDSRLRVHGIKNLRVIDASIMPAVPASHTNAPTMMVGEKGADMIKQDYGKRTDKMKIPAVFKD